MSPATNARHETYVTWAQAHTADEVLEFAIVLRNELVRQVQEADAHGDGPLVNAICHYAREVFVPNTVW